MPSIEVIAVWIHDIKSKEICKLYLEQMEINDFVVSAQSTWYMYELYLVCLGFFCFQRTIKKKSKTKTKEILTQIPPDWRLCLDTCEPSVNARGTAVHAASLLSSTIFPVCAVELPEADESPGCMYTRKTTMEFASHGTFLNCAWE